MFKKFREKQAQKKSSQIEVQNQMLAGFVTRYNDAKANSDIGAQAFEMTKILNDISTVLRENARAARDAKVFLTDAVTSTGMVGSALAAAVCLVGGAGAIVTGGAVVPALYFLGGGVAFTGGTIASAKLCDHANTAMREKNERKNLTCLDALVALKEKVEIDLTAVRKPENFQKLLLSPLCAQAFDKNPVLREAFQQYAVDKTLQEQVAKIKEHASSPPATSEGSKLREGYKYAKLGGKK